MERFKCREILWFTPRTADGENQREKCRVVKKKPEGAVYYTVKFLSDEGKGFLPNNGQILVHESALSRA